MSPGRSPRGRGSAQDAGLSSRPYSDPCVGRFGSGQRKVELAGSPRQRDLRLLNGRDARARPCAGTRGRRARGGAQPWRGSAQRRCRACGHTVRGVQRRRLVVGTGIPRQGDHPAGRPPLRRPALRPRPPREGRAVGPGLHHHGREPPPPPRRRAGTLPGRIRCLRRGCSARGVPRGRRVRPAVGGRRRGGTPRHRPHEPGVASRLCRGRRGPPPPLAGAQPDAATIQSHPQRALDGLAAPACPTGSGSHLPAGMGRRPGHHRAAWARIKIRSVWWVRKRPFCKKPDRVV